MENGYTVPSLQTLEKMALALEVPLYRLFHNGSMPPEPPVAVDGPSLQETWGVKGKDAEFLHKLRNCLAVMSDDDRKILFHLASRMVKHAGRT